MHELLVATGVEVGVFPLFGHSPGVKLDVWGEYLGDPPLAMALLDRIVDGAIIMRIAGKSYRAHRGAEGKSRPETVQ